MEVSGLSFIVSADRILHCIQVCHVIYEHSDSRFVSPKSKIPGIET